MFLWGKKVEAATDLIFLGPKITADVECNHEIKRYFLLGRKAMTNLDSVLKSRDIILPTKVPIVKAMVFPVVTYKCEKAEELKLSNCGAEEALVSPLGNKESKPVNPKGNQSEYSLEELMLKLKLQSFGHLMQRTVSLEKTLMLGKTEGRWRSGWQKMRWLDGIATQ